MNLLNIQPKRISKDESGYTTRGNPPGEGCPSCRLRLSEFTCRNLMGKMSDEGWCLDYTEKTPGVVRLELM